MENHGALFLAFLAWQLAGKPAGAGILMACVVRWLAAASRRGSVPYEDPETGSRGIVGYLRSDAIAA